MGLRKRRNSTNMSIMIIEVFLSQLTKWSCYAVRLFRRGTKDHSIADYSKSKWNLILWFIQHQFHSFLSPTQNVPHLKTFLGECRPFSVYFFKIVSEYRIEVVFFIKAEMYTLCMTELMNSHSEQHLEASEVSEGIFVKNVKCLIMKTNEIFALKRMANIFEKFQLQKTMPSRIYYLVECVWSSILECDGIYETLSLSWEANRSKLCF